MSTPSRARRLVVVLASTWTWMYGTFGSNVTVGGWFGPPAFTVMAMRGDDSVSRSRCSLRMTSPSTRLSPLPAAALASSSRFAVEKVGSALPRR